MQTYFALYSQYAYAGVQYIRNIFFLQQLHNTHTSDYIKLLLKEKES